MFNFAPYYNSTESHIKMAAPIDVLFKIALHLPTPTKINRMRRIIAVISSCSQMWNMRKYYYEQKYLIDYGEPILNFWQPEIHYYTANKDLYVFFNDDTQFVRVSSIYEGNNTIHKMVKDDITNHDYARIDVKSRIIAIIRLNELLYIRYKNSELDVKDNFNSEFYSYVAGANYVYGKLIFIDLSKSHICWSHKSPVESRTEDWTYHIELHKNKKELVLKQY